MTEQKKTAENYIDATPAQAAFLTKLAGAFAKYHESLEILKSSVERELSGGAVLGIHSLSFADVQKAHGAIEALDALKWDILYSGIADETEEVRVERLKKVSGWLELVKERNPDGMNKHNWFFAESTRPGR